MNEECTSEQDIIQKYDLNMEGSETWDEERWEKYEHDRWMIEQELGERYYELFASEMEEETEDDKEVTRIWREEEEIARKEYFRKLEEEETKVKIKKEDVVEAIYYSEDEEYKELKEKDDSGGKEEKLADDRYNGPFDTSIPQEMTTPPGNS